MNLIIKINCSSIRKFFVPFSIIIVSLLTALYYLDESTYNKHLSLLIPSSRQNKISLDPDLIEEICELYCDDYQTDDEYFPSGSIEKQREERVKYLKGKDLAYVRGENAIEIFKDVIDNHPELNLMETSRSSMKRDAILWWTRKYEEVHNHVLASLKEPWNETALFPNYTCFNHILLEPKITTKGGLQQILKDYEKEVNYDNSDSWLDFHPLTFFLSSKSDVREFWKLYEKIKQKPKNAKKDVWIIKPTSLSSGNGIKIFDDNGMVDYFREYEGQQTLLLPYNNKKTKYVFQKYVEDPLLMYKKKFHIRIYFLVVSIEPLKVLFFNDGDIKIASKDYKLGDFDNPIIHLSNLHQQNKHEKEKNEMECEIDEEEEDVKIYPQMNFFEFRDYLVEKGLANENFLEEKLYPDALKIVEYTIKAFKHSIKDFIPSRGIFYTLFAADTLYDTNFNLWMTEVQGGPGLSMYDPHKKRILHKLFEEMILILKENQDHVRENNVFLEEYKSRKNFIWAINE